MASSTTSAQRFRPRRTTPWALTAISATLATLFAFPAIYLVWRNFTSETNPLRVLFTSRTLEPLQRTLVLAVAVSVTTAFAGTLLAWLTTRTDLPGQSIFRILLPLPLVYPTFVGAAAFIRTLTPGGIASDLLSSAGVDQTIELRGLFGAWLVLSLFTYPYVYLPVAARLRGLPGSLEESARLLGDSSWQAFRRVVLPQTASAITTGTLLVFLYAVSDFGAVQLMRYDTLTRAIWTTRLNNQQVSLALSLILLVLAAVAVGVERTAAKRLTTAPRTQLGRPLELRLGRVKSPALVFVVVTIFLGLAAPAIALADWAITGIARDVSGQRELFISASDLVEPTMNTAIASGLTAVLAVAAVLPVAYLVTRYRSRSGEVANAVVIATFALPGLLVALAMFFWTGEFAWTRDNLRGTLLILIFAYVVRFGAQAMGSASVAVAGVPPRLNDAAQMLGAGRFRRFFTVDVPIMAPGLLAGAGLVLLSTMKELPITLFVAPFDFPTLTTKTFANFEDAFVAEAGLYALTLVVLSAALTWVLIIRKSDHLR